MILLKHTNQGLHMALIQTSIVVTHDESTLVVPRIHHKDKKPPFHMMGKVYMKQGIPHGYDVHSLFESLSPTATWLFWRIDRNRNYETNIAKLSHSSLTQSEILKVKRAYKELETKRALLRVKKETYMINPMLMLPSKYQEVLNQWEELLQEKGLKSS